MTWTAIRPYEAYLFTVQVALYIRLGKLLESKS